MLILAMALMAADPAPASAAMVRPAVRCAPPRVHTESSGSTRPRKLEELPAGQLMLAVNKTVDGCPVNVLMRKGPSGRWVEEPAPHGRVTPAPSQPQGRLDGDRQR